MDILTKPLPTKIRINNKIYDINYDYRTAINILQACEDDNLTHYEKLYIMVKNLYKKDIPNEDFEEACKMAVKFLDMGEENNKQKKQEVRIYSFKKDANYIFTGINQTHHIDIDEKKDLHWWKFMSFFMDMTSECMFGELVYYRTRKAKGKLTKEEKKHYEEIKDLVELETVKKTSEARKKFFEQFNSK